MTPPNVPGWFTQTVDSFIEKENERFAKLDRWLADTRAKGGNPTTVIVPPLLGEIGKAFASRHRLKCYVSRWSPVGSIFLMDDRYGPKLGDALLAGGAQ